MRKWVKWRPPAAGLTILRRPPGTGFAGMENMLARFQATSGWQIWLLSTRNKLKPPPGGTPSCRHAGTFARPGGHPGRVSVQRTEPGHPGAVDRFREGLATAFGG
jgi:hypothetical protein